MGRVNSGSAFTLVEVMLALGIATFALLSVVALLPIGLGSLRASMDDAMEARILRRVSADIQMAPFTTSMNATTFYFDGDGEQTTGSGTYRVTFTPATVSLPNPPPDIQNNFRSGVIRIDRADDAPQSPALSSFPVTFAKNASE